jgi:hypothetical protein
MRYYDRTGTLLDASTIMKNTPVIEDQMTGKGNTRERELRA